MESSQLILQQFLSEYSHLDLTSSVSKEDRKHVGGGGFSDVYRSKLREDWEIIVKLINYFRTPSPTVHVAVKVLRLFDPVDDAVEKVRYFLNSNI